MKTIILMVFLSALSSCGKPNDTGSILIQQITCSHPVPGCPNIVVNLSNSEYSDGTYTCFPSGSGITTLACPDTNALQVTYTPNCNGEGEGTSTIYTYLDSECSTQKF